MHGIMAILGSEKDPEKAALDASLAFSLNPLPISEVRRPLRPPRALCLH